MEANYEGRCLVHQLLLVKEQATSWAQASRKESAPFGPGSENSPGAASEERCAADNLGRDL